MYVPRFGETNIVYDVISGNNILTTKDDNTYGTITIQNGILTKSNDLTFDSHTGLLYGKSSADDTWSLDSVVIDKGILTKSNNTLGFSNPTGILYGSATGDTWSLESTKITDGIFTRSNNTLVFNNPNGLLYGSTKDGVWSLNNVNNIDYVDNTDYVLYYVKSNDGSITPQWKVLTINGKNFEQGHGENVKHQWRNMEINENDKLVLNETEYLKEQDYGVFNCNGTVMPLTTKVLNDIGLKLFSPSEINEVGYVTTNVILYNSSMDNVSFPVNYYGVLNFHSQNLPNKYSNEDIKSTMLNLIYTKGFYNYTTISNNLPIYEQIKTTYDGFYNYLETNLKNNTSDNYLHFTTTLNVDSIIMPKTNNNFYTIVNDNNESYSIDKIKNYRIVIGIYTNFNKVQENTFYQNTFFCNSTTQVLSFNNTDVLLGYLIIDLANIDNTTHKVNINQLLDIDSTIPYNTNINNLTAEQLKNYVLSFRPLFYINNNDNIIHSLYYNSNKSIIEDIKFSNFDDQHISINDAYLTYNTNYVYYNNCIRFLNNITSDINTNKLYQNTTLVIPSYGYTINNISSEDKVITEDGIKNTYTYYTITAKLNELYYDTKPDNNDNNKKNIYLIDNSLQAYSYISSTTSTIYTSQLLGYIYSNNSIYHAIFNTDPKCLSHQSLILSTKYYTKKDKDIIINDNNQTIEIFKNNDMHSDENAIYISIDPTKCNIDGYNNLIYDNVNFSYNTYILNKYIQIDKSIVYIDTSSNVYILANNNNNTISDVAVNASINNTNTTIEITYTNNLYILTCQYYCDILYKNIFNNTVGKQLFLCNDDYIFHKELTIRSDILKYTTQGVSYNGNFIFNKDDVSMNILGQIIVNTNKYYYRDNAIYNDFTDYKVLEATNEIQINYREYIEVTNSNFNVLHNEFIISGVKKDIYSLCKPLKYFNNTIQVTQKEDNAKTFYFDLENYVKGDTDYGDDCILQNILGDSFGASITGNNILLGPYLKDYSTFNSLSKILTFETNTKSESDSIIHTKQGLSITTNNDYVTSLRNISDVVYTNDYIDVPFFDTPIEKDMKIVLKPISKNSIISYNRNSDNKSIYTLAKNVGFKISLCNIYVTLTSYIGEYPTMIN